MKLYKHTGVNELLGYLCQIGRDRKERDELGWWKSEDKDPEEGSFRGRANG